MADVEILLAPARNTFNFVLILLCGFMIIMSPFVFQFLSEVNLFQKQTQSQEEWEDENRERGNINDEEWAKIQLLRKYLRTEEKD